jgi:hypothetical protein
MSGDAVSHVHEGVDFLLTTPHDRQQDSTQRSPGSLRIPRMNSPHQRSPKHSHAEIVAEVHAGRRRNDLLLTPRRAVRPAIQASSSFIAPFEPGGEAHPWKPSNGGAPAQGKQLAAHQ